MIGPPEGPSFALSLRVRSGLIACQLAPPLVDCEEVLRRGVELLRIVRREEDREVPLEALLDVGRARSPSDCRATD